MKNKMNQMLKDKLFLVMLVLGLLTIVAAVGIVNMRRDGGENPYMNLQEGENLLAKENMDAIQDVPDEDPRSIPEEDSRNDRALASHENPDTVIAEDTYELARNELEGTAVQPQRKPEPETKAVEAGSGLKAATALVLDFTDTSRLEWPVRGNVILDYSMDTTIYFPTLDQYKCNPGMVIQGDVSIPVYAPANARVLELGNNEEIGNFLKLDFGNDYTAVCGQLKEIPVLQGEYLEKGQLLGYIAEPTKYYTIEGANVYFELKHGDAFVDPLDYLK